MNQTKVDQQKLTQHERVVLNRATKLGMSVAQYAQKFGSKNLPHLLGK